MEERPFADVDSKDLLHQYFILGSVIVQGKGDITKHEAMEEELLRRMGYGEDVVQMPKEDYEVMIDRSLRLDCLEDCGVDNWQGYGDAMDLYREAKKQEDGI